MQIACWDMPWVRTLRAVALLLACVLALEWTVPLGGFAQSKPEPGPTSAAGVEKQESPPMQETAVTEDLRRSIRRGGSGLSWSCWPLSWPWPLPFRQENQRVLSVLGPAVRSEPFTT